MAVSYWPRARRAEASCTPATTSVGSICASRPQKAARARGLSLAASARACGPALLGGLGAAAEIEPDLAEWDYGDYEGKRSTDIRKQRAGWNIFRDGCPRGETPAQVSDRADRLIARLRALEGNVALFSHGQFGCVLAARWIGLPPAEAQHFALGTASLSILGFGFHHPEVGIIAMWNAASSENLDPVPSTPW